jgi:HlyD family secretion protein
MKKIGAVLIAVVVLSLFGGTVWFLWAKSNKPETVYLTESPRKATIIKKAVATGAVVPRQEVEIKPRVSGIVDAIYVEAGQHVEEGALVARIRLVPDMVNLSNAQSRVTRAEIGLDNARQEYERNKALQADGLISQAAFQPFDTAYQNARAELAAAQENLGLIQKGISASAGNVSNTLVRSTISGMVLEVPVEVGHSVIETNTFNAGTTLATVADMDDMIFEGNVDESEVGKLKPGMALLLTIGAVPGKPLEATLEHIAPKGVEEDGAIQFEIRAALAPQSEVLVRANYSANADIVLDRRDDVLAINESLLQFEDGKHFVEVETGPQKFEKREIQTGLSDGIQIEVVAGVTESDKIKAQAAPARREGNG